MMKRFLITILLVGVAAADDKKANVLLQAAQAKETVQGDLKAAIDLYAKAAKEAGANRALAAKALLHLGQCHEKLGDAQARSAYERIVREFGDQREASEAKTRLAALGGGRTARSAEFAVRQLKTVSDRSTFGQISPDGTKLSVGDWGTSQGDLAVVDLAAGEKRLLTHEAGNPDGADLSAWSPDGRQIAFGWWTRTDWLLRVIGADGSGARVVHRCDAEIRNMEPWAWSLDGKSILVSINRKDRSVEIGWVAVADGSVRVLKKITNNVDPGLRLSPDGRYIAYEIRKQTQKDISLISSDGSRESVLIEHPANDLIVGWAPDGKRLLFASDRTGTMSLWSLEIIDGSAHNDPELLRRDLGADDIWSMGVTRNGSLYYSVRTKAMSDIYVAELDPATGKAASAARPVAVPRSGSNFLPQWSPDAKWLLSSFQQSAGLTGGVRELWITDPASGETREIHANVNLAGGPRTWAPDAKSILVRGYSGDRQTSLYTVDVQTGAASLVSKEPQGIVLVTWSKDLKRYSAMKAGNVVAGNAESGEEKTIYQGRYPREVQCQALSPDGAQVVAGFRDRGGPYTLRVIPATGGEPHELVSAREGRLWFGWGIGWSPDGRYIFYSARDRNADLNSYTMWRVPAAGGEPVNTGITMTDLRDINVNPDGRRVAFSVGKLAGWETWVMENFLPAASGKPVSASR